MFMLAFDIHKLYNITMKSSENHQINITLEPGEAVTQTDLDVALITGARACVRWRRNLLAENLLPETDALKCYMEGVFEPPDATFLCQDSRCAPGVLQQAAARLATAVNINQANLD